MGGCSAARKATKDEHSAVSLGHSLLADFGAD